MFAREQLAGLFHVGLKRAGTGDGEKFTRLFGEIRRLMMRGYRLVDLVQHTPQRVLHVPKRRHTMPPRDRGRSMLPCRVAMYTRPRRAF